MHLVLNHRVGAHHQFGLAAGNQLQHGAAFFGLLRASEPRGGDAQRLQPAQEFAEVLLGQYLGGRHQCALPAGVHANGCGQCRHYGLARADIPLQQAVHGDAPRHVGGNLGTHALLGGSQCKRQLGQECGVQRHQHRALRFIRRIQHFGRHHGQRRGAQRSTLPAALQLTQLLGQQFFGLQALPSRMTVVRERVKRHVRGGVVQKQERLAQCP